MPAACSRRREDLGDSGICRRRQPPPSVGRPDAWTVSRRFPWPSQRQSRLSAQGSPAVGTSWSGSEHGARVGHRLLGRAGRARLSNLLVHACQPGRAQSASRPQGQGRPCRGAQVSTAGRRAGGFTLWGGGPGGEPLCWVTLHECRVAGCQSRRHQRRLGRGGTLEGCFAPCLSQLPQGDRRRGLLSPAPGAWGTAPRQVGAGERVWLPSWVPQLLPVTRPGRPIPVPLRRHQCGQRRGVAGGEAGGWGVTGGVARGVGGADPEAPPHGPQQEGGGTGTPSGPWARIPGAPPCGNWG